MDGLLQDLWSELLECDLSEEVRLQVALPVTRGGLGVGSLSLRHASAFVGSWCLCLAPVLRRLSLRDSSVLRSAFQSGDGSLRSSRQVLAACESLQHCGVSVTQLPQWDTLATEPVRKAQRFFSRVVAGALFHKLLNSASVPDRARLRSAAAPRAGLWTAPTTTLLKGGWQAEE